MMRTVIDAQESGVDGYVFKRVLVKVLEKLHCGSFIVFWRVLPNSYKVKKSNCAVMAILFPDSGIRINVELNIVTGTLVTVSIESDIYWYKTTWKEWKEAFE